MDSLGANHAFLSNRPSSFRSLEHAIEWRLVVNVELSDDYVGQNTIILRGQPVG